MMRQAFRFGLVGGIATAVHMVVGSAFILSGLPPQIANLLAFVTAFFVSFSGHFGFSFVGSTVPFSQSLRRFALVAIAGFALNQSLLIWTVKTGLLAPTGALILSTSVAAIFTFGLSKLWAFRMQTSNKVQR